MDRVHRAPNALASVRLYDVALSACQVRQRAQ
jgi:hypothetical protein